MPKVTFAYELKQNWLFTFHIYMRAVVDKETGVVKIEQIRGTKKEG